MKQQAMSVLENNLRALPSRFLEEYGRNDMLKTMAEYLIANAEISGMAQWGLALKQGLAELLEPEVPRRQCTVETATDEANNAIGPGVERRRIIAAP